MNLLIPAVSFAVTQAASIGLADQNNPVGITNFSALLVIRDWADWGSWGFNGLLVVVGGLQIWLLFRTWKTVRRQADWMRRQTVILSDYNQATHEAADASAKSAAATEKPVGWLEKQATLMEGQLKEMKAAGEQISQQITLAQKNVDYIANTERAWVMGELGWYEKVGPNIQESSVKGAARTIVMMKLTCKNEGKSPAWIENVYTRLDITSGSLIDEIDTENLGSNGRWGALSGGESRSQSVEFLAYDVRGEGEFLSVFVIIEYRDIFDIKRETFLGYSIDAHGNVYRQNGLPNRNRNT
jgi:hypothetical protein